MKFSTRNFLDTYPLRPRVAEWVAIEELIRDFTNLMRTKMFEHFVQGKEGWDKRDFIPDSYIQKRLKEALVKGDYISVANYSMILHNRFNSGE